MKKIVLFLTFWSSAFAYLPKPHPEEVERETEVVRNMAKEEIFSLSTYDLAEFIWDQYWKGSYGDNFHYYGANPKKISPQQAKKPAIIFLHAQDSNHGEFIPMLRRFQEKQLGPCYTINYDGKNFDEKLIQKIEEIRKVYSAAGKDFLTIQLIGHSVGATNGVEFAYTPSKWPEDTRIERVIAIAGRIRNIDDPMETPYYSFSHEILVRLDKIWRKVKKRKGGAKLFTIAGENDWLVPLESLDVGLEGRRAVIPDQGHLLIIFSNETFEVIEKFLKQPDRFKK